MAEPANAKTIYKAVLLDHFHKPRRKGELTDQHVTFRGRNPQCGDEIEVGGLLDDSGQLEIRFRGRGCSVCLASASIMAEACNGLRTDDAFRLHDETTRWLNNESEQSPDSPDIAALGAVKTISARKKCVLLGWQALSIVLKALSDSGR